MKERKIVTGTMQPYMHIAIVAEIYADGKISYEAYEELLDHVELWMM